VPTQARDAGLRRDAIGLPDVLFQSVTAMAPAAAIAASIPAGAGYAGGALPLSVLLALVACLLSAFCIAELAKRLPAAGSVATYTARGLHPAAGFLVAWGYVFTQGLVPALLLLQFGFTTAGTLNSEFGASAGLWWPWVLLGAAIVATIGFFGVRASARFGAVLGAFEILVFLVLAVLFVVKAGDGNTLSVFGTSHTPAAHSGFGGVVAGSVYTVLAFAGFEASAPLAEEARDPGRTVRRAILGATLVIGALYVFTTYAVDVAYGPGKFNGFGADGASSWEGMARASYGAFWVLVFLAVVNSTIANANAGTLSSTRTAFAMARIRVFPERLATVHPRHRSPYISVMVQTVISLAVALGLGFAFDPVTAFAFVATMIVIVQVLIYIVVNGACIGYFARQRAERFRVLAHLVVPVLGIAAFVPAWLTAAGIHAFSFVTPLVSPISNAVYAVIGWFAIGLVALVWLRRSHPDRITEVGRVHLDAADPVVSEPEPA
jgi:amino acid transporter